MIWRVSQTKTDMRTRIPLSVVVSMPLLLTLGCQTTDEPVFWRTVTAVIAETAAADPIHRTVVLDPDCFQGWTDHNIDRLGQELSNRGVVTDKMSVDCDYAQLPGQWSGHSAGEMKNETFVLVFSDVNPRWRTGDLFFYLECGPECQVSGTYNLMWSSGVWRAGPHEQMRAWEMAG